MANKIYIGQEGAQELYRRVKALIPAVDQELDENSSNPISNSAVTNAFKKFGGYRKVNGTGADNHPDVQNPDPKVIYLVEDPNAPNPDHFYEWIWEVPAEGNPIWRCIGTATMDLEDYYTKDESDAIFATKDDLPTIDEHYAPDSSNAQSGIGVTEAVAGKADVSTTLAGYGISDAYTKTQADALLADKQDNLTFDGTYDATTNPAATVATVESVLPATPSTDSVLMSQDSTKKWVSMTSNNYEIPLSLSPDIPYEYRKSYKQVEYIQSNDDCIMVNNLNFKSSDKFKAQFYVKNRYDNSQGIVACTEAVNGSGNHGFNLQVNPAYYPGQFWYSVAFGSLNSYKVITYHSGSTYPDRPEFEARQEIIAEAPNLWVNGDNVINNATLVSMNLTCVRYVSISSSYSKNIAFGIFAIYDNNDTLIEKLVPCLNKSTNKYGVFCVNQKQFYGAYSGGTITEYIPPST